MPASSNLKIGGREVTVYYELLPWPTKHLGKPCELCGEGSHEKEQVEITEISDIAQEILLTSPRGIRMAATARRLLGHGRQLCRSCSDRLVEEAETAD